MGAVKLLQNNGNSVVIGFFDKLSKDNAAESEAELIEIRKENSQGELVFDFEGLEYISSAGLRVILNCAKSERGKIRRRVSKTAI